MRRKLALLLCLILIIAIIPCAAYEPIHAPLEIEFTSGISLIAGFADEEVSSTVLTTAEDITGDTKYFSYDSDTAEFYINNIYFYLQVFTISPVNVQISGTPLSNGVSSINWTSLACPYGTIDTASNSVIRVNENEIKVENLYQPRVYSDEIHIRIPANSVPKDTTGSYAGRITIEVIDPS